MRRAGSARRAAAITVWVLAICALGRAAAPPASLLQQAENLVEWGRWKQARQLIATAVAQPENRDQAALWAYYGHLQAEFDDLKAADELTRKATKMDPACAACHLYRFEALARRAETMNQFRALLQLHGIKKELETAERLDPRLADIQWGWIRLDLTLPAAVGGSTSDAYKHADRLAQLDPVDGHLARAAIAQDSQDATRELNEVRAAARDYPQDPRGVFALGKTLYLRHDFAGAVGPLSRAWEMNHQSALYAAYYAANLVQLRQPEAARAVLDTAHQIHPDSRLGDFLTAQALLDTGQDAAWAHALLASYLAVPPEPNQPTAEAARKLLAAAVTP
ncbi:MAG: tetratricopeptide repeat protein [Terriglobales bacterium]